MKLKSMKLFLALLAMASVASAGMLYDAGSAAGKGGFPDTPGSIVDSGSGSSFWVYNNAGATLSVTPDSWKVDMSTPVASTNTYARVYFNGTPDTTTPVTDLGFDTADGSVHYQLKTRIKVNSFLCNADARVFRAYLLEGHSSDSSFAPGLRAIDIMARDGDSDGTAASQDPADYLEITLFGQSVSVPFSMGEWHDVVLDLSANDNGVRRVHLYVDDMSNVAIDGTWANYHNYNNGRPYTYFGMDSGAASSFEVDTYEISQVPEPATMLLLGLGGLLSLRRRKA